MGASPIGARASDLRALDLITANRGRQLSGMGLIIRPGAGLQRTGCLVAPWWGTLASETRSTMGTSRVGDTSYDEAALVNQHPH